MKLEAVKRYRAQKGFHEPNQQCNWAGALKICISKSS
jgi:hypothetical protein